MIRTLILLGMVALCTAATKEANAQEKATAAKEVAKRMLTKFSGETDGESVESLAGMIVKRSLRHGDEADSAVENVVPQALKLMAEAGENVTDAAKLMAKHECSASLS